MIKLTKEISISSHFIPVLICTFLLLSCSKPDDRDDDNKVMELDKIALSYFQLRTGQYFIYKDTATGKTDSVVVTQSAITTEPFSVWGVVNGTQQVYNLTLTQKGQNSDSIWLKAQAIPDAFGTGSTHLVRTEGSDVLFGPLNGGCQHFSEVGSYTVEGKTYTNVHVSRNITTYYWAQNVGLIKFTVMIDAVTPRTYVLLRHN